MESDQRKLAFVHKISDTVKIARKDCSLDKHSVINYKKLVVPAGMRSIYWKYYGLPASEDNEIITRARIVCLLCKAQISYNWNTSNLRMHLQSKHRVELEALELLNPAPSCKSGALDKRTVKKRRKISKKEQTVMQVFPMDSQNEEQLSSNNTMPFISDMDELNPLRVIVKEATSNQAELQICTTDDGKLIADVIAEFLILDMQLPDIVEGRGFQRLIATLKSPCEIPSKFRLVDEIIPRMYESVKEHLLPEVESLTSDVSLSVEDWISSSGDVYSTVSIHYLLDNESELQTKVLTTIYCSEVDALYWGTQFDSMILEWSIKVNKIKAIIVASDRDEVYDSLIARAFVVIPCLSHTLQVASMKACFEKPELIDIINKCRGIIALVAGSQTASDAMKYQENILQLEENSFVMDQSMMWVTTFNMLEQLLARRPVLGGIMELLSSTNVFPTTSLELTDIQWAILEDVITVLSPLKVTMVTLGEEKTALVSLLKPIMWQLLNVHLEKHQTDSQHMIEFKTELSQILMDRYKDPKIKETLEIASFLDPRFKKLPFMSENDRPEFSKKLKQMLQNFVATRQVEEQSKESTHKKPRLSGMEFLLGDLVPKSDMPSNKRADLELVQYECESPANLEKLPTEWWKEMGTKYGQLSKLASQFLCMPACVKSYPNTYPCQKPAIQCLSPQLAHKMKFLHRNYPSQ